MKNRRLASDERFEGEMLLQSLLLILGFALLIKGADIFVDAAVNIAERLRVPKVIIAMTIVAIGTGAPEAVISVTASARGSNALAIGNIVGSNIFNLVFIIGLCAVIMPMAVKVREIHKEFWISIVAAVLLLVLKVVSGEAIPRWGSLVLLVLFFAYMCFVIRKALRGGDNNRGSGVGNSAVSTSKESAKLTDKPARNSTESTGKSVDKSAKSVRNFADESTEKPRRLSLIIFLAVLGLAFILVGGHFTVESATYIAYALGVSERVIGITIIAVGTSLPELITSLVACKKGENEFALGNIIGSNIFNILFVLGVAGLVNPLEIDSALLFDTIFLVAASSIAILFVYTNKRIGRLEGAAMVLMYCGYMVFAVMA